MKASMVHGVNVHPVPVPASTIPETHVAFTALHLADKWLPSRLQWHLVHAAGTTLKGPFLTSA